MSGPPAKLASLLVGFGAVLLGLAPPASATYDFVVLYENFNTCNGEYVEGAAYVRSDSSETLDDDTGLVTQLEKYTVIIKATGSEGNVYVGHAKGVNTTIYSIYDDTYILESFSRERLISKGSAANALIVTAWSTDDGSFDVEVTCAGK